MEDTKIILLVEDNPDDEALAVRALNKISIPHKIITLRDGQQALDYFFSEGYESREHPQLILLDLKLPRIGGLDVLSRLRVDPKTKMIPTVILTSSKEEQDMLSSYDIGANSYIRKPIDFNEFMEVVSRLGVFWLTLNTIPPTS